MVGRVGRCGGRRLPKVGRPTGERVGEAVGGAGVGEPGEQALDVAVAVGPSAPREKREGIPARAAEIPGATQSDHRQKEQGQEERTERGLRHAPKAGGRRGRREGLLEGRDEAGFVRGSQQEQASCAILPNRLRFCPRI